MNILIITSLTKIATANYLITALRGAHHSLLVISDVGCADVTSTIPSVAEICKRRFFTPDFAFFIEGGTMQVFPIGLEALPCPTAWYAIDTHTSFAKHVQIAPLFDVTFIAHRQFATKLATACSRPVIWLPPAFPIDYYRPSSHRPIDLAFVGSLDPRVHPDRLETLNLLASTANYVSISPADPQGMFDRYNCAKVVFNQSISGDLNMRCFEAMGSGAVLLTNALPNSGLSNLFQEGVHYISYNNPNDALAKFRSLLANPDRCAAIGSAARKLVLANHTYDHRTTAIVEDMRGVSKSVFPSAANYLSVFSELNMPVPALRVVASGLRNRPISKLVHGMATVLDTSLRVARFMHG